MKKQIKVNFTDFWVGFSKMDNYFYHLLAKKYEIIISSKPDILFYSTFGKEYLKYDCIRIFFTGENVRPDFNLCDYAIGYDRLLFGDRYIRFPLYMLYQDDWKNALKKHEITEEVIAYKKRFCNFIYSNSNTTTNRDLFMQKLTSYKPVDSGGKYKNNTGYRVDDKVEWQKNYKFTIAFENSVTPGYVTEKLIHAYAAQTIPIYRGDPEVLKDFNKDSLIICASEDDFSNCIEKIKEVDQNPELYLKMLQAPMLRNEKQYDEEYNDDRMMDFLQNIIEQPYAEAFRRDRYAWTSSIENEQHFLRIVEKCTLFKLLICKKIFRR